MANETKKVDRLPITDDYIFKRVFAFEGNESALKDLLEAILNKDIKTVTIKNPEIIPYEKDEKRGLLDIKAETDDGTILDIEMQMEDEKNTDERGTQYLGKMITEQLKKGDKYKKLKKSIVIFITNYNFLKRNSYHSVGKMKFEETLKEEYVDMGYEKKEQIASKYIEFHYIELPKYKREEPSKFTKLDQWMCIFTQNEEGIEMAEKENKEIKRAIDTLDFISEDPKERERHNSIVMAEYNRLTSEHNFFEAGVEKGIEKGKKEGVLKTAKAMLKRNMPIETIMEITELTREEIEKLK
jgi:predicted transposase/invertase (TIGR01784 family)